MEYTGTYSGFVVSSNDNKRIGRVQVRVPIIHGISGQVGLIDDQNLPWALPSGLPAGGSDSSGGISWLPKPGDQVWVRFLDGELEKPVWEWGNQTIYQTQNYGHLLHKYDDSGSPVERATLSRYGHQIEFNEDKIRIITASGFIFNVCDTGDGNVTNKGGGGWDEAENSNSTNAGSINLKTPTGYAISLDEQTESFSAAARRGHLLTLEQLTMMAGVSVDVTTPVINLGVSQINFSNDYGQFAFDGINYTTSGMRTSFRGMGGAIMVRQALAAPEYYVKAATPATIPLGNGVDIIDSTNGLKYDSNNIVQKPDDPDFGVKEAINFPAEDGLVRFSDLYYAVGQIMYWLQYHTHPNAGATNEQIKVDVTGSSKIFASPTAQVEKPGIYMSPGSGRQSS